MITSWHIVYRVLVFFIIDILKHEICRVHNLYILYTSINSLKLYIGMASGNKRIENTIFHRLTFYFCRYLTIVFRLTLQLNVYTVTLADLA